MATQHQSQIGSRGSCPVVKAAKGGEAAALETESRGPGFALDEIANAVVAVAHGECPGLPQEQQP
ncbi:MAG: hypothetical protein TH68_05740 [Candidatus Synechococcus spongiarum 142]|uniref:Uncharacterized protein n=1 Tax=Candidatus Synechococcus spongiarum 142 TaxID=1608213 RepID=A0A6N3X4J0_9SYNE|nr:MAG: hypothetical protein TH68_05740 [Candidatus Synechococcus spongiarum 142]